MLVFDLSRLLGCLFLTIVGIVASFIPFVATVIGRLFLLLSTLDHTFVVVVGNLYILPGGCSHKDVGVSLLELVEHFLTMLSH